MRSVPKKQTAIPPVHTYCQLMGRLWARKLTRLTLRLSKRTLIVLLVGFVLSGSGLSIFMICKALRGDTAKRINIAPISKVATPVGR